MTRKDFYNILIKKHKEINIPPIIIVHKFYDDLLSWIFPEFNEKKIESEQELISLEKSLKIQLLELVHKVNDKEKDVVVDAFFEQIPNLYFKLQKDVSAILNGDPAANSENEVISTYPGFYAIVAYRIAHEFYKLENFLLARMITEYAHQKTGIDIHPGSIIGENFCIDHGTGIVIGQTTTIGDNVKIYQGVTLGALSVNKEDAENKRHPTLENGVIVYSGATILGGKTIIGKNSVIGGNVWITKSVPENSKIYYKQDLNN